MEEGLKERPREGDFRRAAVFDVAFPSDLVQYRALNKMAILAVRLVGSRKTDFPVERVFIREEGKRFVTVLPRARPDGPPTKASVGHIQDVFVLVPIRLLYRSGDLGIRVSGGADEMRIGRLPIPYRPEFLDAFAGDTEFADRVPAQETVRAVLADAYCIKE
jgi:hypothetical protein